MSLGSPIQSEAPRGLGRTHRLPPDPPQRRERAPQRPHRKLAGKAAFVILGLLAIVTGSLAGMTLVYSADLPQIQELETYRPSTTTDLYDIKGRVIGSFALQRRVIVDYNGFAPVLRQAVVSIEDKDFYSHGGINLLRIWGAAWHDVRSHGRAQGASTLTMQLARNLFLSADRNMVRKFQEAYLAIQIERTFTKEQIFTLYGNQITWRPGTRGRGIFSGRVLERIDPRAVPVIPLDADGVVAHRLDGLHLQGRLVHLEGAGGLLLPFGAGRARAVITQIRQSVLAVMAVLPVDANAFGLGDRDVLGSGRAVMTSVALSDIAHAGDAAQWLPRPLQLLLVPNLDGHFDHRAIPGRSSSAASPPGCGCCFVR